MDDFLHHLIVVAAFFAAALAVKIGVAFLALTGSSVTSHTLPVAVQLLSGLVAAYAAHHRARHPRLADGAVSRS